jgi:hypothetical protein
MWKADCRRMGWVMVWVVVGGCQGSGSFTDRLASWWRSPQDPEYRLLLQSIDEYARKNGLTREQAIRQLREEADRYALQQRQEGLFYAQQPGASAQQGYSQQAATSTSQGGFYSQRAPTGSPQGGGYIPQPPGPTPQGALYAQQPAGRSLQGQSAGSGVNQTSWAQASDQQEKTPPMGLKPSSTILR